MTDLKITALTMYTTWKRTIKILLCYCSFL